MIYDFPAASQKIKTGDIFSHLPFVVTAPKEISIESDGSYLQKNWNEIRTEDRIIGLLPIKPVFGIVLSQECDIARNESISFFLVDTFESIVKVGMPGDPKKFGEWLPKIYRQLNSKFFYLPQDDSIGFEKKMACNFNMIFQVNREWLLENRNFRIGRLKKEALTHYRELTSQYFRRYAVDDWYPFTKDEFDYYLSKQSIQEQSSIKPRKYQKNY